MQALRQRVEALRLLVDSREEEAEAPGENSGPTRSGAVIQTASARMRKQAAPGLGVGTK